MRHLLLVVLMSCAVATLAAAEEPPLLQADQPITAGWRVQGGALELSLTLAAPTTITVACPVRPGLMEISGLQKPAQFSYDAGARRLTMKLGEGRYQVRLREWDPR